MVVVNRPKGTQKLARSFVAIDNDLQGLSLTAQHWVTDYTLFTNPFLNAQDMLNLVHDAWAYAQDKNQVFKQSSRQCHTWLTVHVPSTHNVSDC